MANGYVNPFIRLPPYHPLYQQQQLQLRRQMQAEAQAQVLAQRRPNDPSVLFSPQQAQPQCLFPSAFPAHGPNIIQRFWIRLFWFFANPLLSIYRYVKSIYDTLQPSILTVSALARQRWQERDLLMQFCVENSWSLLIGLVVIVVLSTLAWFFSPKGENNTVWRSTLILTFASCYIMWAITFLAQWHPLVQPKMASLRAGYDGAS